MKTTTTTEIPTPKLTPTEVRERLLMLMAKQRELASSVDELGDELLEALLDLRGHDPNIALSRATRASTLAEFIAAASADLGTATLVLATDPEGPAAPPPPLTTTRKERREALDWSRSADLVRTLAEHALEQFSLAYRNRGAALVSSAWADIADINAETAEMLKRHREEVRR